jgi:hypothetical protein
MSGSKSRKREQRQATLSRRWRISGEPEIPWRGVVVAALILLTACLILISCSKRVETILPSDKVVRGHKEYSCVPEGNVVLQEGYWEDVNSALIRCEALLENLP